MTKNVRFLAQSALIAALYMVLTLLQNLLLPGTTSDAIQFRVAEALCVLSVFTPAAIPGLTLGCLLYNLISSSALPLDFLIGSGATFLAALFSYLLRRVRIRSLPLLSLLMPVLTNALLVGWELTWFFGELPFGLNVLYVALGELGVMLSVGVALYYALSARHLDSRLFGR